MVLKLIHGIRYKLHFLSKIDKKRKQDIIVILSMAFLLFGISFSCFLKKDNDFSESERRILKQFGRDFSRVKGYSLSRFLKWVSVVYQTGYDDGWNEAMDSYMETDGGIAIDESVDAEIFDTDAIMEILLSVKGIGEKRAAAVIEKICAKEENG